jgi:hypothetical protein
LSFFDILWVKSLLVSLWFSRRLDDEKLKHNEEEDGDPCSEPSLCLNLLSFSLVSSSLWENQHVIHRIAFPLKIMKQNAKTKDRHLPLL